MNSANPDKKPADQDLIFFIHLSFAGNLCKHLDLDQARN